MGESDRYIDYKRSSGLSADGNALIILISINAMMFVLLFFIQVLTYVIKLPQDYFVKSIAPYFFLPANPSTLLTQPWTLLTYMFSHTGLIFTLTNLIWLWVFGAIFQQMKGNRMLVPIYIYGGLAGAVAFVLSMYFIPSFQQQIAVTYMQGANSATMAVALATTAIAPDYRFFRMIGGGIPLWILTMLYLVIDFAGVAGMNGAYNIAHLAGALIGFLFVFSLRKGKDWSAWMIRFYDWITNLFNPNKPKPQKNRIKEKVFYKTGNQPPFVKTTNITQQRVDEILDKINVKGYHFLTEEEKNILKRASEHL